MEKSQKGNDPPITDREGELVSESLSNTNGVRYCSECRWGAKKMKEGWAIYDSNKKFHHIETQSDYTMEMLDKGLCPIHGVKLE